MEAAGGRVRSVAELLVLLDTLADEYEAVLPHLARELRAEAASHLHHRRGAMSGAYRLAGLIEERVTGFRRDGHTYTAEQIEAGRRLARRIKAAVCVQ